MKKYPLHADLSKLNYVKVTLPRLMLPFINGLLALGTRQVKPYPGIKVTHITIPSYERGEINLVIYEPHNSTAKMPCLMYLHGGAFMIKASPHHHQLAMEYALKTPCKVVLVDYRLAPKFPFPYGLEDSYATWKYIHTNAQDLGVDSTKIAIGGDSAGGALAAAISLMSRDQKDLLPCFQMLLFPVLDARQTSESMKKFVDTPMWNAKMNRKMWNLYLQNRIVPHREYASPLEATNFKNLPTSYIEVCQFDCLHDEGVDYSKALVNAGVEVELNRVLESVHGYDLLLKSNFVQNNVTKRIQSLQKGFKNEHQ